MTGEPTDKKEEGVTEDANAFSEEVIEESGGESKKKKAPKQKKPKLTREEKKALRAEERILTRSEIREGFKTFNEVRTGFMTWLGICVILALSSLFFTSWTAGSNAGSFMVVFNVTSRVCSLFALTLFGVFTHYKKTVFVCGVTVWTAWMLILSNVPVWLMIAVPVLLCAGLVPLTLIGELKQKKSGEPAKEVSGETREWVFFFYFSVVFALVLELMHSFKAKAPVFNFGAPFMLLLKNPDKFMNNAMVVFFTGIWTRICRKRKFATAVFMLVWLILAFGSLLKINNVYEPLMLLDIFATIDMAAVVTKYFSVFFFAGVIIGLVLVIGGLVFLIRMEKPKRVRGTHKVIAAILAVITLVSFSLSAGLPYARFTDKHEIVNFYNQGFAASFARTFVSWVNPRPEGYTEASFEEIENTVSKEYKAGKDLKVKNIIAIQLESFSDPCEYAKRNSELTLEYDPIPFLRSLEQEYSTGLVSVPVYGGMTVKSEFEFMTGIDLANLPNGLNPYVTTIKDLPIHSLPRYLSSLGFRTTGIHNYQGEFFSRMYVYESLGFDRFVPMETMNGIKRRNDDLWAADDVLAGYIERALDENKDSRNYVFVSTVQLHGSYPVIPAEEFPMKIEGLPEGSDIEGQFQYYVGQLIEFDKAIKDIVDMLEARDEPTVLVMYADHLPGIAKELCELSVEDAFRTRYYIWTNLDKFGIEFERQEKDLPLYKLSTLVLDRIGLDGDFINKFHEVYADKTEEEYAEASKIVDYKLAYESGDIYDDGVPLVFGFDTPKIIGVTEEGSENNTSFYVYRVKAEGVTDNTVITINGKVYNLVRRSSDEALFYTGGTPLKEGDVLTLRIIGERVGFAYLESEEFVFK
ncbi:MAG: LTA synthase family protein [Clostridia bacterium]|nr:LTA synthase family protein [Clostridia bacterium]